MDQDEVIELAPSSTAPNPVRSRGAQKADARRTGS